MAEFTGECTAMLFTTSNVSLREHIHVNATRWETLTEFTKWLGREGLCKVDEIPRACYIQYRDRTQELSAGNWNYRKEEARP